jgi:hypothetical protein
MTLLPFAPAVGWSTADLPRRAFAVAAVPLAALLALAVLAGREPSATVLWAWAFTGPATCFALARVLRPERRSAERTPRHVLAATATSYAVPVLAALSNGPSPATDQIVMPFGTVAFVLGCSTAVWGLVAFTVRASRRHGSL